MDLITLKNFRCFGEQQTARLAPLTLLVGENSTGKTSFMAMIRALWDLAYANVLPDFKEEPYDLGSFDEIANYRGGRAGRATAIQAAFEFRRLADGSLTSAKRRFEVTFKKEGTVPVPVRRRLSSGDLSVEHEQGADGSWQSTISSSRGAWRLPPIALPGLTYPDSDRLLPLSYLLHWPTPMRTSDRPSSWTPIRGNKMPTEEDWNRLARLLTLGAGRFPNGAERPFAGAAVRSRPRRTYDPSRTTRDPEGDYIPMFLAQLYFKNRKKWDALKAELDKFGAASGLFRDIDVKQLSGKASGPFQIELRRVGDSKAKGPPRNLIDVGYGVSQVLPVIAELRRPDSSPMLLLQQPEVHLHPRAQAALGTLLCEVAATRTQIVVETHGDYLTDRVRIAVRDGDTGLKPEDISILYFERRNLDVHIHSLTVDAEGNICGAPDTYRQFFMEETSRSLWREG